MSKLICHYKKNEKGSWDMTITIRDLRNEDGILVNSTSCHYPRSRKAGINSMLATLWMMKPGEAFTITAEWEA